MKRGHVVSRSQSIYWFNTTVRKYVECAKPTHAENDHVLIIHRNKKVKRSIINIAAVQEALIPSGGSELVVLHSNTSVQYQLCLPITRSRVLGAHGAALSLFSFFAPPSFKRLELMPYGYNAAPYVNANNMHHLSIQLSQIESVECGERLTRCTSKEGSIDGLTWKEVATLWWPRCRAHARNCNLNLTSATINRIQYFFNHPHRKRFTI